MFDKGKISIPLTKTHYMPGDMITGELTLTMKKEVKAKDVSISLIGEQTNVRGGGLAGGEQNRTTTRIYDFKQQLDGEQEYNNDRVYPFEIMIPSDILSGQAPQPGGTLGKGFQVAQAIIGTRTTTKWYLLGKLDIPHGIDVKKEVSITIG